MNGSMQQNPTAFQQNIGQQGYGIERNLNNAMYSGYVDRSYLDKVFMKEEVNEIKTIMKKTNLDRQDLLAILYLMAANEIKLVNFGDHDRYLLGKYFAWIRDFVANCEILFDYHDKVKSKEIVLTEKSEKILEDIEKIQLHSAKFLVDIFFFISRSTLALGATAFTAATTNKFEYAYPSQNEQLPQPDKRGFFNLRFGGNK